MTALPSLLTSNRLKYVLLGTGVMLLVMQSVAQELEPRRWSHLPIGVNFAGIGGAYYMADIFVDPVLQLEDVKMEEGTLAVSYLRTFKFFDKSARAEVLQAVNWATWSGLLAGQPAETSRQGLADPRLRLAVNLVGAPPLKGEEFARYRAGLKRETIVGMGLVVHFPLGSYQDDKLLNLGANRFTFRPQVGVTHNWGKWSVELTGSLWFYTANDDFVGGHVLEQDPLLTMQAHCVYTFRPGLWLGCGMGYGYGGQSIVDGTRASDLKGNLGYTVGASYSFTRSLGIKFGYTGIRTMESTGLDSHSFVLAMSVMW